MAALSDAEVLNALKASGFPLEIRLLEAFSKGGMNPSIGLRVAKDDGTSREIDIVASLSRTIDLGSKRTLALTLRLLVEAKSMPSASAWVGFPWTRPTPNELRKARIQFGGRPSCGIAATIEGEETVSDLPGVAEAFDSMNAPPVCVQWAVVRHIKKQADDKPFADHEDSHWKGIDGVVRSCATLAAQETSRLLWTGEHALTVNIPVLAVGTPQIRLVDARSSELPATSCSPAIILHSTFDLGADIDQRTVDVVSESGIPDLIQRCERTMDALAEALARNADRVVEIARSQSDAADLLALKQIAEKRSRAAIENGDY